MFHMNGGVSIALEHGDEVAQGAKLIIEYDPQPPFNAGCPEKALLQATKKLREMRAGSL